MKKLWIIALLAGATLSLALLLGRGTTSTAASAEPRPDSEVIASIVKTAATINLNELTPIPAERFVLPPAGVDVMRVRMEETYTINGVGTDTIELKGYIVAKHDTARPAPGQTETKWETAVIDTEFVALDLHGESKIFGPVHVTLSPGEPSLGQVGAIDVPELRDKIALLNNSTKPPAEPGKSEPAPAKPKGEPAPVKPEVCAANIRVNVNMPQLNLQLKTLQAVRMFSIVDTIPPVGTTASVSLAPVTLVSNGREVGTLQHAEVKFREIVLKSPLRGTLVASR